MTNHEGKGGFCESAWAWDLKEDAEVQSICSTNFLGQRIAYTRIAGSRNKLILTYVWAQMVQSSTKREMKALRELEKERKEKLQKNEENYEGIVKKRNMLLEMQVTLL